MRHKEHFISTSTESLDKSAHQPLVQQVNTTAKAVNKNFKKRYFKSKRRVVRNSLVIANVAVVLAVMGFVLISRQSTNSNSTSFLVSNVSDQQTSDPLDTVSSADIAVNIAQLVQLDETVAVTNNADSINSQLEIIPAADSQVVAKPQIVSTEIKSVSDVESYIAVDGDSVSSIAQKFGISANSVRWSNGLSGDNVAVGTELVIPPVEGFVYTVAEGDTAEKIADKYSSTAEKIIAFNDAEIDGLATGDKIVIPDGSVPVTRSRFVSPSGFRFGASAIYGYNGYDYGYCTWYAANRRAEIGRPVPANLGNAISWKSIASRAGIPVGNVPQSGAVIWTPASSGYGHVGFVEEVFGDGSVRISEMNTRGWGVRSEKVLTPEQAAGYGYIY
jgi:surface antigen